MIWEWKSNFEFSDEQTDSTQGYQVDELLSKISVNEIQSLQNRINFYLAHFMILARKTNSESSDTKISYLKKLNTLFENELHRRQNKIYL